MPQLFVRNAADISLENLKQEKLDVEMLALGDLRATGEVQNLELKLNGSARADLTGLKVKDIRADARGNSRAFLRGHGAVNIAIADLAAVSLYERPASLKTTIDTFGRFYQKF